jgi:hypothetical protein
MLNWLPVRKFPIVLTFPFNGPNPHPVVESDFIIDPSNTKIDLIFCQDIDIIIPRHIHSIFYAADHFHRFHSNRNAQHCSPVAEDLRGFNLSKTENQGAWNQGHLFLGLLSSQIQFLTVSDSSMAQHFQVFPVYQSRLNQGIRIFSLSRISFLIH